MPAKDIFRWRPRAPGKKPLAVISGLVALAVLTQYAGAQDSKTPGQGESCLAPPHACAPDATLDCVWFPDRSICGTNHVWLNVAHNRLSLPLSGIKDPCEARFADLNVAKWTCQSTEECRGITRDHGIVCDGEVRTYELRRGILWDTTPDNTYNAWVRRDFVKQDATTLDERMPDGAADPCLYRRADLQAALDECALTEACHGIIQDEGITCDGTVKTFDLRSGDQADAPGTTAWIYRVRPAAD